MHSDVLIVGAGSAGSVLAQRLSADPRCHVTVVEAGPGPGDPRVRSQIADGLKLPIGPASSVVDRYDTILTGDPIRRTRIIRGAVLGGSGAVNGGYFCRGLPGDFAAWALPGWSWHDVLPHFVAIETDTDVGGRLHGLDGPIIVRRVREFDGPTATFVDAAIRAGHRWIADLNGSDEGAAVANGIGAVPLNVADGTRLGPGAAFLEPALGRSNLAVVTDTRIHRIRFAGNRAIGVDGTGVAGTIGFTADRIVLCAGAIGSARLLMLSGVGPEPVLSGVGIAVVADLPVGRRFVDHPEWVLPVRWRAARGRPPLETVLTTSEGLEIRPYTAGFGAMSIGGDNDAADHPYLGVALMRPVSRGRITLVSADPAVAPAIEHRYDSSPEDLAVLRVGAELARELAGEAAGAVAPSWSTSQHLAGTAPMGADGDPSAVLDPSCRVRGVDGLWVVDGSIMPSLTSRGPHATIVMIGHRAAEFVSR